MDDVSHVLAGQESRIGSLAHLPTEMSGQNGAFLFAAKVHNLRVVETDFLHDHRWAEFVESHPEGLIYHHPEWLSALQKEYGQRCLGLMCVDAEENVRGVLPLFYTRGSSIRFGSNDTGRRLSSLPRTPVAGPLANNRESTAMLIETAMDVVRHTPDVHLELKSSEEGLDRLVDGLTCVPWRLAYVIELPPRQLTWGETSERSRQLRDSTSDAECPELRFGNARRQHRVMWGARRALKEGLVVRLAQSSADLRQWYDLYLETMRRVAIPPRPYRMFANLWQECGPCDHLKLFLVERPEGARRQVIAGSIVMIFGQTAFWAFTGCSEEHLRLHPHDLLQLAAIRHAYKTGVRWYDLGEVPEEHAKLARFKRKWGASPKRLYHYYFPVPVEANRSYPSLVSGARIVWRGLPKKATALLGDLIYRSL